MVKDFFVIISLVIPSFCKWLVIYLGFCHLSFSLLVFIAYDLSLTFLMTFWYSRLTFDISDVFSFLALSIFHNLILWYQYYFCFKQIFCHCFSLWSPHFANDLWFMLVFITYLGFSIFMACDLWLTFLTTFWYSTYFWH